MQKDNLEIVLENILGKFDLVLEGHEALRKEIRDTREDLIERISLVDFKVDALSHRVDEVDTRLSKKIDEVDARLSKKIDDVDARLGQKIDAVAADLRAHREDTEAHPKIYRVGEQ